MRHVCSGNIVGDHRQTVGAVRSRGSSMSRRLTRVVGVAGSVGAASGAAETRIAVGRGKFQCKVNGRDGAGNDGDVLRRLFEALAGDADGVVFEGHGVQLKFTSRVGGDAFLAQSEDLAFSITIAF